MDTLLKRIRLASLMLIAGGMMLMSAPQEASAFYCQFCVHSCPSDVEEYCEQRSCTGGWAACIPSGVVGSCYPYSNYMVSCNLI